MINGEPKLIRGFPGDAMVKTLSTNAGDLSHWELGVSFKHRNTKQKRKWKPRHIYWPNMDNLRKGYSFGIRVEIWRDINFYYPKIKMKSWLKRLKKK